jgi:hypothetical protein
MTAVIGIINKSAAAIAADSAVTVTGTKGRKIFNRANKIFRISNSEPIGVMVYNQGEFLGTPWEPIMKLYRNHLGDTILDTVEQYKTHFIQFLHDKGFYCDVDQQKRHLTLFIRELLNDVFKAVLNEQRTVINSNPPNLAALMKAHVETKVNQMLAVPVIPADTCVEFAGFDLAELDAYNVTNWNDLVSLIFSNAKLTLTGPELPGWVDRVKQLTVRELLSKNISTFYSGIVFAGYGNNEIFPSLIPIKISVVINNRLKYIEDDDNKGVISHTVPSVISPFAQVDVIDTILAGADPGIYNLYLRQFQDFIKKHNQTIANLVQPADATIADQIRHIDVAPLRTALDTLISQNRIKFYINPMMNAVSTLSKEDLAEMAESLIYLTYLKRRFTASEESVGGPVDVAVITKGDGFIWIKRKHYFNPDLNRHFFKNY